MNTMAPTAMPTFAPSVRVPDLEGLNVDVGLEALTIEMESVEKREPERVSV